MRWAGAEQTSVGHQDGAIGQLAAAEDAGRGNRNRLQINQKAINKDFVS